MSGRVRLISSKKSNSGSNSSRETMSPVRQNMAYTKHTPSPPLSHNQSLLSTSSNDGLRTDLRVATMSMVASQNVSSLRSQQQESPTDLRLPAGWDSVNPEARDTDFKMMYTGNVANSGSGSNPGIGIGVYGTAASVRDYPVVKFNGWEGGEASSARYSNTHSHSSHPGIDRMVDGMEYGHQQHGFVSHQHQRGTHLHLPQIQSQTHHPHPHIQSPVTPLSQPDPHLGNYSGTSPLSATVPNQPNVLYHHVPGPGGNTPPEMYATAPRELKEMGLASHQSGINQRWTSFIQTSGVFYNSGNSM